MMTAIVFPLEADRDASGSLKSLRRKKRQEEKGLRAPSKLRWSALSYSNYP
jgi:hypothetical protein